MTNPPIELGQYQALFEKYAQPLAVAPAIHGTDFIFHFLINNPSFDSKESAIRYYFHDGRKSAEKLRDILRDKLRFDINKRFELLEFAAGYGCVTRHLKNVLADADITSCDIHEAAVRFLSEKLGVKTILSSDLPEQFSAGKKFNIVFALSFFSHMPAQTWGRWLKALFDCVLPGGFLIFTTHGEKSRRFFGDPEMPADGYWFRPDSEQKDLDTGHYGQAIVTPEYVARNALQFAGAPIAFSETGFWWDHQDLFVIRRSA